MNTNVATNWVARLRIETEPRLVKVAVDKYNSLFCEVCATAMASFVSNLFRIAGQTIHQSVMLNTRQFHALPTSIASEGAIAPPSMWSLNQVRTKIRNNWPRPSENKRIKKLGWKARLSCIGGRRVIMRRILKGKHVLTH